MTIMEGWETFHCRGATDLEHVPYDTKIEMKLYFYTICSICCIASITMSLQNTLYHT
jgi:hypothetical protein